jgi:hypothetical protein
MMPENVEYANSVNHEVNENGDVVVNLYDANKGKTPRTGGPYLDEVQAEQAEINRAKQEGREPDLDNPPPYVGTQLVPASQLTERDVDKMHYADTLPIENEPVTSYVAEFPEDKADPTQADWDNNMDKVNALRGATEYKALVEKNNVPDPEPVDDVPHPVDDADLEFDPDNPTKDV